MPRSARSAPGGYIYHVLNRANGHLRLFKKDADYVAFENVLQLAHQRCPTRILGWCVMPTHWHMVLWPSADLELTRFLRWLTLTHAQRWKHAHNAVGQGHLYHGRFKCFPIQQDAHVLTVLRYIERNPLRSQLIRAGATDYPWSSAHVRVRGPHADSHHRLHSLLSEIPVPLPRHWNRSLDVRQHPAEETAIQISIQRSRPFGSESWIQRTAKLLDLQHTLRPLGRPLGWRKKDSPSRE